MLEKIMFRPKSKIMENGFPRTKGNRKFRPLTTSGKKKKNTVKNIRKRKLTRTTSGKRRIVLAREERETIVFMIDKEKIKILLRKEFRQTLKINNENDQNPRLLFS